MDLKARDHSMPVGRKRHVWFLPMQEGKKSVGSLSCDGSRVMERSGCEHQGQRDDYPTLDGVHSRSSLGDTTDYPAGQKRL